jgi:hypothetical protein
MTPTPDPSWWDMYRILMTITEPYWLARWFNRCETPFR